MSIASGFVVQKRRVMNTLLMAGLLLGIAACGGGGSSGTVGTPPTNPSSNNPPANGLVGLNSRPSNTSCIAPTRTSSTGSLGLTRVFANLSPNIITPMKLIQPRNDASNWYAITRTGGLDRFANNDAATTNTRYLNLSVTAQGEGGFLSAAFHPNWPTTKEIYVSYTINSGGFKSRLSRLVITNDSTLPASYVEEVLITINQPQENHNGSDLEFGADGYLYYSMGDGGGANDPGSHGQNPRTLLATVMRIDVLGVAYPSPGYNIPAGNPFAGNSRCGPSTNASNCPEIFAYGVRNPWRMSFDPGTGSLWLADVGQNAREEVNIITAGANYGWPCREGSANNITTGCATSGFTNPIYEYSHNGNNGSITGGYVYRGSQIPGIAGQYIFADYNSGEVFALRNSGGSYTASVIGNVTRSASLSKGNDGEIYVLGTFSNQVFKVTASGSVTNDNVPNSLQATGCVNSSDPTLPAAGLIPYQPSAEFWSDGAAKKRWIGLPSGATITPTATGNWTFPPGTVLVKNFQIGSTLAETRLFMRHPDGVWAGYSYLWNDVQTDATRVRTGTTKNINGQTYIYPSEGVCFSCHTSASGFVLGLETAQLNSDFTYPSTNRTDNQIEVFNHIGLFSNALPEPVSQLIALTDPTDTSASIESRARAYLETNCAQCHHPAGTSGVDLDLRASTPFAATRLCNISPQAGGLGLSNPRLIAPGDAGNSVLVARTNRRDGNGMPPLASNQVDDAGVALLSEWVNNLTGCP